MVKDPLRRALALWLALLVVTIVVAAAMVVWMQPDLLSTANCPVHGPGMPLPPGAPPFCN